MTLTDTPSSIPVLEQDGEDRLHTEIERNLSSGKWAGGMRLPTERALAQTFGIARARVRRVLRYFEQAGRISRTVGRGTFVTKQGDLHAISDKDIELISPEDLIEVRLIVEPNTAELLVRRASAADISHLRDLVTTARQASSMAEFEEHDHQFHLALAYAAKNTLLTGMLARMLAVRQSRSWIAIRRQGHTKDRQALYQSQHEAVLAALEARDSAGFRRAMFDHLMDVRRNLGFG